MTTGCSLTTTEGLVLQIFNTFLDNHITMSIQQVHPWEYSLYITKQQFPLLVSQLITIKIMYTNINNCKFIPHFIPTHIIHVTT